LQQLLWDVQLIFDLIHYFVGASLLTKPKSLLDYVAQIS
jgi:hypothetical protein